MDEKIKIGKIKKKSKKKMSINLKENVYKYYYN